MEIRGKKVVVFGGASGMGRASAELLAARGADVVVVDRPGSGGDQVAAGFGGGFHEAAARVDDRRGSVSSYQPPSSRRGCWT
jgi:NAD(P)-dependent dehydrogenase (short-subunit alcohol dehydrogenase family)